MSDQRNAVPKQWRLVITWEPKHLGTQDLEDVLPEVIAVLTRLDSRCRRGFTVRIEREED